MFEYRNQMQTRVDAEIVDKILKQARISEIAKVQKHKPENRKISIKCQKPGIRIANKTDKG